jgi:hypothetical protein
MAQQHASIEEWKAAYDSYDIAHDMETVNEGLAVIVGEYCNIAQECSELAAHLERFKALKTRAYYLAQMKSTLQSILRTLREV